MTEPLCVRCARPTLDGYACSNCAYRAGDQLHEIVQLAPAARDVAYGQASRGGGASANKPGSRPPVDFGAMVRLDEVKNDLIGWVRHVIEERGARPLLVPERGDAIVLAAQWLPAHLEWLRHRQEIDEVLADIAKAARNLAGLANGREPGRYAGPCSAVLDDPHSPCPVDCGCHHGPQYACTEPGGCGSAGCGRRTCGQDVESRPGAGMARCRACGAEYDVDEQQAWMRGQIEGQLARPVEIAGVLLRLGFPIGYSTIAAYAAKGRLIAHGSDAEGNPLYRIGDVMTLRVGAKKP